MFLVLFLRQKTWFWIASPNKTHSNKKLTQDWANILTKLWISGIRCDVIRLSDILSSKEKSSFLGTIAQRIILNPWKVDLNSCWKRFTDFFTFQKMRIQKFICNHSFSAMFCTKQDKQPYLLLQASFLCFSMLPETFWFKTLLDFTKIKFCMHAKRML